MPILEALVTLGFIAAVTERVTLATEVLVLPQRQAVLVAKQVSTLDTLSGGRMRLGIGVGWQEAEYEALGEDFARRGPMMDEAIGLLRACWGEERIERRGGRLPANVIALGPKPTGGRAPPPPRSAQGREPRGAASACRSGSAAARRRRCAAPAGWATAGWDPSPATTSAIGPPSPRSAATPPRRAAT